MQTAQDNPAKAAPQRSAATRLYRGIVDGISEGQFLPGQRLVEADLCLHFGVSRNVVREVLQRLSSEGVVELTPNKGATVRAFPPGQLLKTLELTELLMGLAARSAAEEIHQPGAEAAVRQALSRLETEQKNKDDASFNRARDAFFSTLLRVSRNEELQRLTPAYRMHVLRAQYGLTPLYRAAFADFGRISEAVLSGNASQAERLARRHIRRFRDTLARRLQGDAHSK